MYLQFEPHRKKQENDIFKYILFGIVVGVTAYTIISKANIKPKMSSGVRPSPGNNYNDAFQSFMSSRGR